MKEEWLMSGAIVPVDIETTVALAAEIKRLIGVIGSMALNQRRTWVGLTDEDKQIAFDDTQEGGGFWEFADAIEAKLKEKNT